MAYDAGLAARVVDALERLGERGIRQKNVFGGWGFMAGKSAFAIVWEEGLIVKTRKSEYAAALAVSGVTAFTPMGEKPMSSWVVVSSEVLADDPELAEWLRAGLRAVRS